MGSLIPGEYEQRQFMPYPHDVTCTITDQDKILVVANYTTDPPPAISFLIHGNECGAFLSKLYNYANSRCGICYL